jgi:hypothetical protein
MVEMDSITLRRKWRELYKPILEDLYKDYAPTNILLTPYAAVEKIYESLKSAFDRIESTASSESTSKQVFRIDDIALAREAHHYAVDLFYKYYFPRKPGSQGKPRRGAPPLPLEYLDQILQLRRKGLKDFEIADKVGQPKDRVRKQLEIAERTWRQALEGIEQIKQRSPHLVAKDPTAKLESKRTPGQPSKGQAVKRRAGK